MTLQGGAHVDLDLDLYLADPSKYASLPLNPHLTTELVVDWHFSTATNESLLDPNTGSFSVQFKNLSLNVGNLIPGFLQEVIQDVQRITKPLQPIVDLVDQDIPGLGSIGIHTSLRKLLESTNSFPAGLGNAFDAINLINNLPSFTHNGGSFLDFGDFGLDDFRQQGMTISPLHLDADAAGFLAQAAADIGGLSGLDATAAAPIGSNGQPSVPDGFSFPLLTDPLHCATELLLGENPALFTYKLPTILLPAEPPPLGVDVGIVTLALNAYFALNIDLSVGYDTSGLTKLASDIKSGGSFDPLMDILHGFYVDDTSTFIPAQQHNNVSIPAYYHHATGVELEGGIAATAGLLGLKVSGGVTAQGSLSLNSNLDDSQHRIHLDQIIDGITSDPLSLFAGSGNISVGLDLSYGFNTPFGDVTLFDLSIAHAVIYDFTLGHTQAAAPRGPIRKRST